MLLIWSACGRFAIRVCPIESWPSHIERSGCSAPGACRVLVRSYTPGASVVLLRLLGKVLGCVFVVPIGTAWGAGSSSVMMWM